MWEDFWSDEQMLFSYNQKGANGDANLSVS